MTVLSAPDNVQEIPGEALGLDHPASSVNRGASHVAGAGRPAARYTGRTRDTGLVVGTIQIAGALIEARDLVIANVEVSGVLPCVALKISEHPPPYSMFGLLQGKISPFSVHFR